MAPRFQAGVATRRLPVGFLVDFPMHCIDFFLASLLKHTPITLAKSLSLDRLHVTPDLLGLIVTQLLRNTTEPSVRECDLT